MNIYPRETHEFMGVDVTHAGVQVAAANLDFAVVRDGSRPSVWTPAETEAETGAAGVVIAGLQHGTYRVFARVSALDTQPVVDCGAFRVE